MIYDDELVLIKTFNVELMKSIDCIYNKYVNWINDFNYDIRLQRQRIIVVLNDIIEITNVDNRTFFFNKRVSSYNEN